MVKKHKKMVSGSDRWRRHGLKMILYSNALGALEKEELQQVAEETNSVTQKISDTVRNLGRGHIKQLNESTAA